MLLLKKTPELTSVTTPNWMRIVSVIALSLLWLSGCSDFSYDSQIRYPVKQYAEVILQLHAISNEAPLGQPFEQTLNYWKRYFLVLSEAKTKLEMVRLGIMSIQPGWLPSNRQFSSAFLSATDELLVWISRYQDAMKPLEFAVQKAEEELAQREAQLSKEEEARGLTVAHIMDHSDSALFNAAAAQNQAMEHARAADRAAYSMNATLLSLKSKANTGDTSSQWALVSKVIDAHQRFRVFAQQRLGISIAKDFFVERSMDDN